MKNWLCLVSLLLHSVPGYSADTSHEEHSFWHTVASTLEVLAVPAVCFLGVKLYDLSRELRYKKRELVATKALAVLAARQGVVALEKCFDERFEKEALEKVEGPSDTTEAHSDTEESESDAEWITKRHWVNSLLELKEYTVLSLLAKWNNPNRPLTGGLPRSEIDDVIDELSKAQSAQELQASFSRCSDLLFAK